ncbi:hypothetical protein NLI96_g7243 [Meripilus lineatus]|uniref:DUF6533 domain-containing protein n=1 Tax=Meripilus lineatus TaxID=2056292 RepID=A0AAD5UZV3_9APHY|nr:hypothetical protein NLI96_g7243 [Physisporinus lineatus]
MLNLASEVEHIWRSRMSWTTAVYVMVRYYALAQTSLLLLLLPEITAEWKPTPLQCYQWMIYQAVGCIVMLWLVQVILIMRVALVLNIAVSINIDRPIGEIFFNWLIAVVSSVEQLPGISSHSQLANILFRD